MPCLVASRAFFLRRVIMTFIPLITTSLIVTVALVTDLKSRRIPNQLTYGGALVGLLIQMISHGGEGALLSVLGWVVGISLLLVPYLLGGMGAGDVKLLGAIGAVMGAKFTMYTLIWTGLAGGIMAIGYLLYRLVNLNIEHDPTTKKFMPYGVAIFIGTMIELYRRISVI
jgi:prepilin peptidase CpaA